MPSRLRRMIAERAERRRRNKNLIHKNNEKLPAGSPMYFYCKGCGAELVQPEDYTPPRPQFCSPCEKIEEAQKTTCPQS